MKSIPVKTSQLGIEFLPKYAVKKTNAPVQIVNFKHFNITELTLRFENPQKKKKKNLCCAAMQKVCYSFSSSLEWFGF